MDVVQLSRAPEALIATPPMSPADVAAHEAASYVRTIRRDDSALDVSEAPRLTAASVEATARAVDAFAAGPSAGPVVIADGCAGGRHRAPSFAAALGDRLKLAGHAVTVQHRDIHRPVVERTVS